MFVDVGLVRARMRGRVNRDIAVTRHAPALPRRMRGPRSMIPDALHGRLATRPDAVRLVVLRHFPSCFRADRMAKQRGATFRNGGFRIPSPAILMPANKPERLALDVAPAPKRVLADRRRLAASAPAEPRHARG